MDTSTSGARAADATQQDTVLSPVEQELLDAFSTWIRNDPEAEDPSGSIETLELLFHASPVLGDLDDQNVPTYTLAQPSADLVNALIEYAEEGEDELSNPATDRQDGKSNPGHGLAGQKGQLTVYDGDQDAPTNVAFTLDDYFEFLAWLDPGQNPDADPALYEKLTGTPGTSPLDLSGLAEAQDATTYALVQLTGLGDDLLLDTADSQRSTLAQAFEEPPAHVVLRDVDSIKPVAALERVLTWLGDGRPLEGAGSPGQENIRTLGELLGLDDDLRGVTSIWEVPRLAAWWRTLEDSGIVTSDESTVRPGTQAKHFTAADSSERAGSRAALVANYLEDVLFTYAYAGKDAGPDGEETSAQTLPVILAVLTAALLADEDDSDFDAEAVAPMGATLPPGAKQVLAQLVTDGILVAHPDDDTCPYTVPEGIKHAVADVVTDATEALWEEP